jgi:antirestriction protein ArdC
MTTANANRPDVYTRITDAILTHLEAGVRPWQRPWNAEHTGGKIIRPLRACGTPYRGVNVLSLWLAATEKGYSSPYWFTFNVSFR